MQSRPIQPARFGRAAGLRPQTASLVALLAVFAPSAAHGHFLWLSSERDHGKPEVVAFLAETPNPEGPEFLKYIERAKITSGGKALNWTKGEETYRVSMPESPPKQIDGVCELGVKARNGVSFRLLYTARVQFGPSLSSDIEEGDHLRVRLESTPGKAPTVAVRFRGRPAPEAVVKAYPKEGDPVELKADAHGLLEPRGVAEGRTALLAKWTEKTSGQLDGKPYDEIRFYATLTVVPPSPLSAATTGTAPFALLPEAVNSFGGAVLGDWLYVYSGHTGETHKYNNGTTTKHFRRLNLKDRTTWEDLPCGPALQGVTLVAHRDRLYRIGGMSAHNRPGEPNDLISVADFARFEPRSKTWTDLPPLPSPRSTHDAVVVGDKIYVVGGWAMGGGDSTNAEFLDTALVFDLSCAEPRWENLPAPPFRRRALTVAAIQGKVYVMGGLTEDGKVVKSVEIYDPSARTWSHGPDLPGGKLEGFAPSAFGVGDKLYLSGADGRVLRLNGAGDGWEVVGKLATPRLTHRLLPGIANDLLAVGGNANRKLVRFIESIPLGG
jgi:Kelch motif